MNSDTLNAAIDKLISESIALDVQHVEDATITSIQEQGRNAVAENMPVAMLTTAINDIFDGFASTRSLTIARTEIGSASSFAQMVSGSEAGMTHKVWRSGGAHVRDSHAAMDGETVGIHDKFSNGGLYPCDPELSAAERINCRCYLQFKHIEAKK